MNRFVKVGGAWCVYSETAATGDTVVVMKRSGGSSTVVLGERVAMLTYAIAPRPQAPAPEAVPVGDLSRIVAMFATAARHLRHPSIVLDGFRVSLAGARSRQPGTLMVTGIDRVFNSFRGQDERPWFGRVSTAGDFQPGRNAPDGLADKLRAFAADPAGEAAAHGHLTGRCCFCNRRLGEGESRNSVEVGYGPDCAEHFGLPWGARAAAAAIAEREANDPDARDHMGNRMGNGVEDPGLAALVARMRA